MATLFSIHATPHPAWAGMGKPSVKSVSAALCGVYDEAARDIVTPDREAVRQALPHQWRKAFDRAGSFWFDNRARLTAEGVAEGATPYLTLRGSRGQTLATIYALPYRFS